MTMTLKKKGWVFFFVLSLAALAKLALAEFEDLPVGAWAQGFGGATVALSQGALSPFHNPAGLGKANRLELSSGIGRYFGARGRPNLSDLYFGYSIPQDKLGVLGLTWLSERQTGFFGKDSFGTAWSQDYDSDYFYAPITWGGNFRIVRVKRTVLGKDESKIGAGIDAGVQGEVWNGFSVGFTLRELNMPGLDLGGPLWKLGVAKKIQNLTLAGDLSLRRGLMRLSPGLGIDLFHGLAEARFGKGFGLDGSDQLSAGLGLNFSPLIIDYCLTFPFRGFQDTAGSHEITLSYRFGAPHFYTQFLGRSRELADSLNQEIKALEEKKKSLEQSVEQMQYDTGAVKEEQVRAKTIQQTTVQEAEEAQKKLEQDRRETQKLQQVRSVLEKDIQEKKDAKKKLDAAKPKASSAPKSSRPNIPLPARHKVRPGDTLRALAKKYYGNERYWETIYKANPDKIRRGVPREGEELVIPEITE